MSTIASRASSSGVHDSTRARRAFDEGSSRARRMIEGSLIIPRTPRRSRSAGGKTNPLQAGATGVPLVHRGWASMEPAVAGRLSRGASIAGGLAGEYRRRWGVQATYSPLVRMPLTWPGQMHSALGSHPFERVPCVRLRSGAPLRPRSRPHSQLVNLTIRPFRR
jgi:hypothetical protein